MEKTVNTGLVYKYSSSVHWQWAFYCMNSDGYKLVKIVKSPASKGLAHFVKVLM